MSTTESVLVEVADSLGLGREAELLEALAETARRWKGLAGPVEGFESALDLVRAAAAPGDPVVMEAFGKLGAANELAKVQAAAKPNRLPPRFVIPDGAEQSV